MYASRRAIVSFGAQDSLCRRKDPIKLGKNGKEALVVMARNFHRQLFGKIRDAFVRSLCDLNIDGCAGLGVIRPLAAPPGPLSPTLSVGDKRIVTEAH